MDISLNNLFGEGHWDWGHVFDCMMTTTCTSRPIPGASSQGTVMTDELFNSTIAQVEFSYAFKSLYNNSEWAKLAMGPLINDIRDRIVSAVANDSSKLDLVIYGNTKTTSALTIYRGQ